MMSRDQARTSNVNTIISSKEGPIMSLYKLKMINWIHDVLISAHLSNTPQKRTKQTMNTKQLTT